MTQNFWGKFCKNEIVESKTELAIDAENVLSLCFTKNQCISVQLFQYWWCKHLIECLIAFKTTELTGLGTDDVSEVGIVYKGTETKWKFLTFIHKLRNQMAWETWQNNIILVNGITYAHFKTKSYLGICFLQNCDSNSVTTDLVWFQSV